MYEPGFRRSIAFAAITFGISIVVGIVVVTVNPQTGDMVFSLFQQVFGSEMRDDAPALLCVKIFLNNLQANLLMFLGGATFGLLTAFILITNGLIIGVIVEIIRQKQGILFIIAALIPHGVFEIPSFILSAALGILLGRAMWGEWRGVGDAAAVAARLAPVFLFVILPLIAVAACVEAFITPEIIRLVH